MIGEASGWLVQRTIGESVAGWQVFTAAMIGVVAALIIEMDADA